MDDDTQSITTWYQGTIIVYKPWQSHIVSFDGCGPKENELIRSLNKEFKLKGKQDYCDPMYTSIHHFNTLDQRKLQVYISHINLWSGIHHNISLWLSLSW